MLRRIPFGRVRSVALRSCSIIRPTTTHSSVGALNDNIAPQEPLHESDKISSATEHDDDNNLWTKAAQRLLESEEPWSSSRRHEAVRAIHHSDSVHLAIALFDRLVHEEQEHNDKHEDHDVDTERDLEDVDMLSDLFSLIIVNWKNDDNRRTIEPRDLLEKLETYRKKGAIQSSIQMYSMILDVASMQGLSSAPDLADYIFTLIREQNMYADPAFYSTAITVYARSDRPDAQDRAEELLSFSLAGGDASVETYTATITAWANSGHPSAPQRAEALLEQMSRTHNAQPDTMAFAAVLNAWAKSDDPNACYRALAILRHMTKLVGIKANAVVYNTVMSAFARQGMAMEAEKLLSELTQKYDTTQDEEYFPSVVLFSVVIDAWSKSKQPDAAIRAEAILDMMLQLSQDRPELLPNKVSFNAVIHAWALSPQPEAPKRAAAIFSKMQDLYQKTGNPDIKPTSISLSTVINAWAKSRHYPDPGPRSEAVLNQMCHLYEKGDEEMKPDAVGFTAVMDAYGKTRHPSKGGTRPIPGNDDIPAKVEELMARMQNSFGIEPTVHSYAVAIRAWNQHARSPRIAVENALALFAAATEQYKRTGTESCKPNSYLYNSLLDVFAKNREPDKALALLKEMESSDSIDTQPDIIAYNTVLSALTCARDKDSVTKAEEFFSQICKDDKVNVNNVSVCIIITAMVNCDEIDPHAITRALEYYRDLKRRYAAGDKACKPNAYTYATVMRALARLSTDQEDAADQALTMLAEMRGSRERPDGHTYRSVLECLSRARNRASTAYQILREMDDKKIVATAFWHYDHVLRACCLTTAREGTVDLRGEAREIAMVVYERIQDPTASTFASMIYLLADDKTYTKNVYQECRNRNLHTNRRLQRTVAQRASYLLETT